MATSEVNANFGSYRQHHRLENALMITSPPCQTPISLRLYDGACRELIGNSLEVAAPQSQLRPRKRRPC